MGRGRREIKRIENPSQMQSTFYKRRDGVFKKARELSILCDADLLLLLFSSSGKLYQYHTPSVPRVEDLIKRYELVTQTKVWRDYCLEQNSEIEKFEKLCELLERELRFMTVDDGEAYSLPVLQVIEQNLEAAINKVRSEKNRKIKEEVDSLETMVKVRQQERYGLCDQLNHIQALQDAVVRDPNPLSYELDLKLGFS